MANVKPIKRDSGKNKQFASTDTIAPSNLAPSGSNGDVLTKDSTVADGVKWAASSGGASSTDFTNTFLLMGG